MKPGPGIFFALAIAGASLLQGAWPGQDLERDTLRRGRIALSSGDFEYPDELKNRDNSVRFLLDGDLNTHTSIYFPSRHTEGTFIIAELGLSHLPGTSSPAALTPKSLRIYQDHGGDFSRIKGARISILRRRANDPDKENVIPPTEVILTKTVVLADEAVQDIPLELPPAEASSVYPEHVFLIIAKIQIESVYAGRNGNQVAVSELEYLTETQDKKPVKFSAVKPSWNL